MQAGMPCLAKAFFPINLEACYLRRQHVFPRLGQLPGATRDAVMLAAARQLPQLAAADAQLAADMRGLVFVVTAGRELRAPSALYDPR